MPATVAVHEISFRGLAGSIFILVTAALVLYVIGFATTGWYIKGAIHEGLWESCRCGERALPDSAWFNASRAMVTIGLIGVCLAFICISIYMCIHTFSKNTTLTVLVADLFISVAAMVTGFAVYGVNRDDGLSWSFAFTVAAGCFTLVAGILSVVQMRKAGV